MESRIYKNKKYVCLISNFIFCIIILTGPTVEHHFNADTALNNTKMRLEAMF